MIGPLDELFSADGFMPHGHCYLWNPALIRLHVAADAVTALSYTSIPFTLAYFARKRRDLPFKWMLWCFGAFIVACGATHWMDIWTLWTPTYWLAGVVKAITAAASLPTAVLLARLVPAALALPTPSSLREANEQLRSTTEELRNTQGLLELRVAERTAALQRANAQLVQENSDRRLAEEALRDIQNNLRHAQKMEAVGRLAGGVAHDFNNLLSIILSYSGMLLDDAPEDQSFQEGLQLIEDAGLRAAALTQQLLAFSRQQVLQPHPVALGEVVLGVEKMLERVIGEHITLVTALDPDLGLVYVDPNQIEQVLVNLVLNARDALPKGGKVWITAKNVAAEETGSATEVVLSIADEGTGMDAATLERIYEPFFTTKDVGKGTGLGLATVFGIVQQSGGRIEAQSAIGRGTTFRIYFPRCGEGVLLPAPEPAARAAEDGTETILVVEDEPTVRDLVVLVLRRHGYNVIAASSGQDALEACQRASPAIHLLLTDVVMPSMDGCQLAQQVAETCPDVRILLMSGYPNDVRESDGKLEAGLHFLPILQKPIRPTDLARRVREVLNAPR